MVINMTLNLEFALDNGMPECKCFCRRLFRERFIDQLQQGEGCPNAKQYGVSHEQTGKASYSASGQKTTTDLNVIQLWSPVEPSKAKDKVSFQQEDVA